MYKRFLPLLSLVCLMAATPSIALAGSFTNIDTTPQKTFTVASGVPVTINVNNASQYGAVVIRAVPGNTSEARSWCIVYVPGTSQPSALRVDSITRLASNYVTLSGQTITFDGQGGDFSRLALYMSIPAGTYVTLNVDGKLVKQGHVNTSFMVKGGQAYTDRPAYDERTAISETLDDAGTDCAPSAGPVTYFQSCSSSVTNPACTIGWQVSHSGPATVSTIIDNDCH